MEMYIMYQHSILLFFLLYQVFLDDHCKEFVYREPKVTSLAELNQRLMKMYSKKFGPDTVQLIHDSGKVRKR